MVLELFAKSDEVREGEFLLREIRGKQLGATRVDGTIYIVLNYCPHAGARICAGKLSGSMIRSDTSCGFIYGHEGRIVSCPWHGWEFDVTTGAPLFDSHNAMRLKTYDHQIIDDDVYVEL